MGIKRDGGSLRVGVSDCWSDAGSSNLVFSTVVSRPYLRWNERVCSRFGSVTSWSERISRSVVRLSLSNLYAGSTEGRFANRHEEGGTRQSSPGLL